MESLRNSTLLKFICYILIPIIVFVIGISALHIQLIREFEATEKAEQYVQTRMFTGQYYNYILNKIPINETMKARKKANYIQLESNGMDVYYEQKSYNYSDNWENYINYIIIDKVENVIYTNMRSNDYLQDAREISYAPIYWNFINGKIQTNLEEINEENIKYNDTSYIEIDKENMSKFEIYSKFDDNKVQALDFKVEKQAYEIFIKNDISPVYVLVISGILFIMIIIYLIWSIGHEKGKNTIELNGIDNIPYEIFATICLGIAFICLEIIINVLEITNYLVIILALFLYFIGYIVCAVLATTTIKRIKAKKFWKSFLIYKICHWLMEYLRKFKREIDNNIKGKKRVFWYYWGYVIISIILASTIHNGLSAILLIIFWIWGYHKIRVYFRQEQEITKALKDIYEGKQNVSINDTNFDKNLKEPVAYVNDIAKGFSNAIEKSLKSERLKTELITNVSHDIKTPLTSIINYVDLLKKEDIQDNQIREYVDILDQKSQRLKKLTEDLVEASKASSGNINLNLETIDLKELINQAIGEFKDKFEKHKLNIETNFVGDNLKIKADNRYMYRIIENLFGNISKYALEGSRVYIDIKEESSKINISIKNISRDKLNISAEELMQRFVRGDKSRYTEGSGLGLSIARSLCELQGGVFDLTIDGDLFKVTIQFDENS